MSIQDIALKVAKKAEFQLRKNAPTILTGVGVAGFVATTAFTIRATAKAAEVLPGIKKRTQEARDKKETDELSDKEASVVLARAYVDGAIELGKIYGPTFMLGSASIVCVLAGHGLMLRRQASLVAVYTALDASFKAYRQKVAEKIGSKEELELYRRPYLRAIDETQTEGEGGEIVTTTEQGVMMPSPYAKFFDESSPNWHKNAEFNHLFLRSQQQWANDRLHAHGHLFLNEVYDALGIPRTQTGQIVGWKMGNGGDEVVDFGIYDIFDESSRAFVNGYEKSILLDFNVDGVIGI